MLKAPYISSFQWALSIPVMSTDLSQAGLALFPSFSYFLSNHEQVIRDEKVILNMIYDRFKVGKLLCSDSPPSQTPCDGEPPAPPAVSTQALVPSWPAGSGSAWRWDLCPPHTRAPPSAPAGQHTVCDQLPIGNISSPQMLYKGLWLTCWYTLMRLRVFFLPGLALRFRRAILAAMLVGD